MAKVMTFSDESPAFLRMPDGNEYYADEAVKHEGQEGKWLRRGVSISWVKDGHLEIGMGTFDTSKEQPVEGTWITLDRTSANRLIRVLRNGRDAAFGQDA